MTSQSDKKDEHDSSKSSSKESTGVAMPFSEGNVSESAGENPVEVGASISGCSTKKRSADHQITKGDEDDEDVSQENIKGTTGSTTMKRASDDVLKQRKLVKVIRKEDGSVDWSKKKKENPFASVNLTSSTTTIGTGSDSTNGVSNANDVKSDPESPSNKSVNTKNAVFGVNAFFSGFGVVLKNSGDTGGFGNSSTSGGGIFSGDGFRSATNSAGFGSFAAADKGMKSTNAASPFPLFGNSGSDSLSYAFGTTAPTSLLTGATSGKGSIGSSSVETDAQGDNKNKTFGFSFASAPRLPSTSNATIATESGSGYPTNASPNPGQEASQITGGNGKPDAGLLPTDYQPQSGEENEIVLLECRCKTHRWGPSSSSASSITVQTAPADSFNDTAAASSISLAAVPPTESRLTQDAEKGQSGSSNENLENGTDGKTAETLDAPSSKDEMTWHEVGLGPLRVLQSLNPATTRDSDEKGETDKKERQQQPSSVRLVQRRQVHTSSATKVLLNQRVFFESTVTKPSDRHVKFTTPGGEHGSATTFLFKFAKATEAQELASVLQREISKAPSSFACVAASTTTGATNSAQTTEKIIPVTKE